MRKDDCKRSYITHNAPQEVTGESLGDEWKGFIGRPYITHNAPQEVTGDSLSDEWKA